MNNFDKNRKIQTVLGLIDSDKAGFTLTHEHLLSDFRCLAPSSDFDRKTSSPLLKNNVDELIRELNEYKRCGGGAIVDVTPLPDLGRNPEGLALASKDSGVNIVMGISHYTEQFYGTDSRIENMTTDQIAEFYIKEIKYGSGDTGIKPGIIGEVGCSFPITMNEFKCLHAAAIAQIETGLPISIHPGSDENSPIQILEILISCGVQAERVIICHIEETIPPEAIHTRIKLMELGCYLSYDTFAVPSDALPRFAANLGDDGRIDQIHDLIKIGYAKQILLSHDSLALDLMAIHGGPGIIHIPNTVIPKMKIKGISEQDIYLLTTENPARVLSIQ